MNTNNLNLHYNNLTPNSAWKAVDLELGNQYYTIYYAWYHSENNVDSSALGPRDGLPYLLDELPYLLDPIIIIGVTYYEHQ